MSEAQYDPSGFFVLRSPLLPIECLREWAERARSGLSPQTPASEIREAFRVELLRSFEAAEVREALFLASPVLEEAMHRDGAAAAGAKRARLDGSLTKYLMRMAGRCTPFGLFAGISVGSLGPATELRLGPRSQYQRFTRIDMGYLTMLVDGLMRQTAVRDAVRYRPNSTLYRFADRARYVEHRPGQRNRNYFLVSLELDEALASTLDLAGGGVTRADLIQALTDAGSEAEEAKLFVDELIDSQVIVPDIGPPVTGGDPMSDLIAQLAEIPDQEPLVSSLESVRDVLRQIDAEGLGRPPRIYREVASVIEKLPADAALERLFQVDMAKTAGDLVLAESLVSETLEVATFLSRFWGGTLLDPFEDFRRAFIDRYGNREVPLLEALDEECGIGFRASRTVAANASPLLAGIPFPVPFADERVRWGPIQDLLLRRITDERSDRHAPIVLKPEDAELVKGKPLPLPQAFSIMITLLPSMGGAERPRFVFWMLNGPSGGKLLGRFCHTSADLLHGVREHLRAEERLEPERLYCEIAHLPEGRIGNVIARPLLRDHEIVFLARSGAPKDKQIPLADLCLSVRNGRVILRSASLDREVVPRLTNAHNFAMGIGVYRLLATLQNQDRAGYLGWHWGPFEGMPFLPRVVYRGAILAPARWTVDRDDLREGGRANTEDWVRPFQEWASRQSVPRWVGLREGDNVLPVDRENPLSVEALIDATHGRRRFELTELPGWEDAGVVSGPEGTFANEIVIPFVRRAQVLDSQVGGARSSPSADGASFPSTYLPGSEWIFIRVHTAPGFADSLLTRFLRPLIGDLFEDRRAKHWFFIRYSDPDFHIRLRIRFDEASVVGHVLSRVHEVTAPLTHRGLVTKVMLDTYEREVARYGGPAGIELCEEIFGVDSEAALELIESTLDDAGATARWQLTLCGMDALLRDLGMDLEQRYAQARRVAEEYGREFSLASAHHSIQDKYRKERGDLTALLERSAGASPLQPGLDVLDRRSNRLAPVVMELRRRSEEGLLTASIPEIAGSLLHMHANRMLPTSARAQEAVLYRFLENLYDSQLARAGRSRRDRPPA